MQCYKAIYAFNQYAINRFRLYKLQCRTFLFCNQFPTNLSTVDISMNFCYVNNNKFSKTSENVRTRSLKNAIYHVFYNFQSLSKNANHHVFLK